MEERGVEPTGTVIDYVSGDSFVVEADEDGVTVTRTVRSREMRRVEDGEDEG